LGFGIADLCQSPDREGLFDTEGGIPIAEKRKEKSAIRNPKSEIEQKTMLTFGQRTSTVKGVRRLQRRDSSIGPYPGWRSLGSLTLGFIICRFQRQDKIRNPKSEIEQKTVPTFGQRTSTVKVFDAYSVGIR
jgi:hypothetical protein